MKENVNLQLCNMSVILFSLLTIPFCFINNIYLVNGISTKTEAMNITNNLDKLVDHINEHKQIITKYVEQRNNLLERFDTNINEINKELDREKNQLNKEMKKYTDQRNILLERFDTNINKIKTELDKKRNQVDKGMDKINTQLEEIEESYNRIKLTIISLISFLVGIGMTLIYTHA